MKTTLNSLLLLFCTIGFCLSQNVEIGDSSFLKALIAEGIDIDGDNLISVEEALAVSSLDISGEMHCPYWICYPTGEITNLEGIEMFINLDTLICSGNLIDSLDLTNNTALKYLDCSLNKREADTVRYLKSIKVSDCKQLIYLDCSSNGIENLDVSQNTELLNLNCSNNKISGLDISNNLKLTGIQCWRNQLSLLDLSKNLVLESLSCGYNQFSHLDLSQNLALEFLSCRYNQFSHLDATSCKSLTEIECESDSLTNLNLSGISIKEFKYVNHQLKDLNVSDSKYLKQLDCSGNQLNRLDITNCDALLNLNCENNILESLDLSSCNSLTTLICSGNRIKALDLSGNTKLTHLFCSENNLENLDLSNNQSLFKLYCFNNQLKTLDVSSNSNLMELMCMENEFVSLDFSSNTSLNNLFCSKNPLTSLIIPESIDSLEINDMPTLNTVCVWELPFPPPEKSVSAEGSPNISYTTDCTTINQGSTTIASGYLSPVRIYPNPAIDFLIIESDEPVLLTIEISTLDGKLISRTLGNSQIVLINISSMEKGIFLITVTSETSKYSKRLIKF